MANIKTLKPFLKGYDPRRNAKGRPEGALSFKKAIRQILENYEDLVDGNKLNGYEIISYNLVKKSIDGELHAVNTILKYLEPKSEEENEDLRITKAVVEIVNSNDGNILRQNYELRKILKENKIEIPESRELSEENKKWIKEYAEEQERTREKMRLYRKTLEENNIPIPELERPSDSESN